MKYKPKRLFMWGHVAGKLALGEKLPKCDFCTKDAVGIFCSKAFCKGHIPLELKPYLKETK